MEEIKRGSVVELELIEKNITEEYLTFKVGPYEGRLPIKELSNNRDLSSKMFAILNIGDKVSVVVIGHNKKENYIELSTRVFRNKLDDSVPFLTAKKIINKQFKARKNQEEQFLYENRQVLDRLRGDLSSNELTFLYELIQNAVDHPNEENYGNNVSVKFEIFENYLLLKHDGALFTENNFKSITGILAGERDDNESKVRRIGYKGIGFKSVFRYTQNVYVRSGNFSFSFNEKLCNSEIGKGNPWEVIPFFQNEIDKIDEIKQFDFFNVPVAFAFEFPSQKAKDDVIEYLKQLVSNPYLLIFLKNLVKLDVVLPETSISVEKSIRKEEGLDVISLEHNGKKLSDWIMFTNQYELKDKDIIAELIDESNKSVPNNFRSFRNPTVSIVIPKDDPENLVNLFTYLPLSETRYNLPYIINADFIPNLDRTNIIPALEYNYKVAEFVGEELLKAAEQLVKNKKYDYLTKLLPIYEESNDRFKNEVKKKFLTDSLTYKIYPTLYNDELCTIQELLIDKTGISTILSKEEFGAVTGLAQIPLSPEINKVEVVEQLISEVRTDGIYDIENLKVSLGSVNFIKWLKDVDNNVKIIKYFSSREDLKPLLKEAIILSSNGDLKKASDLYLSVPSNTIFTNVALLHPEVSKKLIQEEIVLNTKKYDSVKFFENHLLSQNEADNKEDNTNFWNWVYDEWENLKGDKSIISSLKTKKILIQTKQEETKLAKLSETYLSEKYDANSEVEAITEQIEISALFVSSDLISIDKKANLWLKVFKSLGVKTDLQDLIGDLITKLPNIDSQKHLLVGKEVFKYWKKNKNNELKKLKAEYISALKSNLKIKCIDGEFRSVSDVILSDHYTTNSPLEKVLPIIKFSNSISQSYNQNRSDINNWNIFFREILSCKVIDQLQNVFTSKVAFYTEKQDEIEYKKIHFDFLNQLSNLVSNRATNNLDFKIDPIKKIKLQSVNDKWLIGSQIHLSSIYVNENDLDLQNSQVTSVEFLNKLYIPKDISRYLLVNRIGVNNNFKFKIFEAINVDHIKDRSIANEFINSQEFIEKRQYLINRGYSQQQINRYTTINNHIQVNYLSLALDEAFNLAFWEKLKKSPPRTLMQEAVMRNNNRVYAKRNNSIVRFLKNSKATKNKDNQLTTTTELYSTNLQKYIAKDSLLPQDDLTGIFIGVRQDISLEQAVGIQQELSPELAMLLISNKQVSLSQEEVVTLNLVNKLGQTKIIDSESYKLPNRNFEWKDTRKLFLASDENFEKEIPRDQLLHSDFQSLRSIFDIQTLSEDNLVLSTPDNEDVTDDIINFFKLKGKYLSFKLSEGNIDTYEELHQQMINKLSHYTFYECDNLDLIFPKDDPVFKQAIDFRIENENYFYFKDSWRFNSHFFKHLKNLICPKKVTEHWFKKFLTKWDDDYIIRNLSDDFGEIPWKNKKEEKYEPTAKDDLDEVKRELEMLGITPSLEIQVDTNYSAMLMGWKYLQQKGYDVDNAVFQNGFLANVKILEQVVNVMIRSGMGGVFYLRGFNWTDIEKPDWHLLVKVGSGFNSFKLVQNQQQLLDEFSSDVQYNVLRLSKDIGIETLTEMMQTLTVNKEGKGHFIFRSSENSPYKSIFSQIDNTNNNNNDVSGGFAESDNF